MTGTAYPETHPPPPRMTRGARDRPGVASTKNSPVARFPLRAGSDADRSALPKRL